MTWNGAAFDRWLTTEPESLCDRCGAEECEPECACPECESERALDEDADAYDDRETS